MKNQVKNLKRVIQLSLAISLLFMGCKSNKEEEAVPAHQLSGRVFSNCGSPLANSAIVLYQAGTSTLSGLSDSYEESTSTDAQGYFSVSFKDQGNKPIQLRYNNNIILDGIPFGKEVNDIVAYESAKACIQVKLNVVNPRSSSDTLKITNLGGAEDLKIPGPFSSGVLYTANQYAFSGADYAGKSTRITWHFNAYAGVYEKQDFIINKYCNDTIFVTATLN